MLSKIIKVTCAIIESNDQILVAQRSENMSLPLKWEFPGGKLEQDEDPEKCIVREIQEELGVNIKVKQRLKENVHKYGDKSIMLIPFVCEIIGGNITRYEHEKVIWSKPEDLLALDWAEADVPIYNEYLRFLKGEVK
jgi:8-oxo-dGTP diphosphatase